MKTKTIYHNRHYHQRVCNRPGFLLVECLIALAILLLLIGMWTMSSASSRKFNAVQLARQRCIAAGVAQLDSLTATGRAIPKDKITELWGGITVSITQTPGRDQWEGMTLGMVTACGTNGGIKTQITQGRYFVAKRGSGK